MFRVITYKNGLEIQRHDTETPVEYEKNVRELGDWGREAYSLTLSPHDGEAPAGYESSQEVELIAAISSSPEQVITNEIGEEVTIPAIPAQAALIGTEYFYPDEFTIEVINLNDDLEFMRKKKSEININNGRMLRKFCEMILDKVIGMNIQKTSSQVDYIEYTYSRVMEKLTVRRPDKAYKALLTLQPDNTNVTEE